MTTPIAYLLLYAILRGTGVYHAYYSQRSWEISGGTGIYVIDISFVPVSFMEGDFHNRFRWLREPTGG